MRSFAIAAVCVSFAASALSADSSLAIGNGRQPRLASDGANAVYCVFGVREDIFCARSADAGVSFSEPVKVATLPGLMLGKRRGPRIAVTKDAVVISAISSDDGNLVAWRSTDRGKTWSDATRVNNKDRSSREGLHDMAASADGSIAAVWLDLRNRGTQLWGSISQDGGATWEPNRFVYRSPEESICECCHPTVVTDGSAWTVLWRNCVGVNRDMYVMTEHEELALQSDAQRLGEAHWILDACPMDGGDLALGQNGGWATWRREKICYATDLKTPTGELQLGPGEQPVVAMTPAGPAFAWLSARPGDLMFQSPGSKNGTSIAKRANDPDLISLPDGTVSCAYESIEDSRSIVRVFRSTPK